MNYLVCDFDDISLDNVSANGLHWLYYLKGKFPDFKCTLFAIPGRSTFAWLDELAKIDWLELALHGWNHDKKELINQELLDKWPYKKVYKGPEWKVTEQEIDLLHQNHYILAVKKPINSVIKQWSLTDPNCYHGHIWVEADLKKLEEKITPFTEFKFISQIYG